MPKIETRLQQAIEDGELLSTHLALLREGQVETRAFGTLGPEESTTPDGHSAYQIGSITKVFTNLLLAEMVAADPIRYEATIQNILGDEVEFANPAVGQIRLMQLATHTSGLPCMPLNCGIRVGCGRVRSGFGDGSGFWCSKGYSTCTGEG